MKRTRTAALLALVVAVPAAPSVLLVEPAAPAPRCFISGTTGYRIADAAPAAVTVRIDNAAIQPDLRLEFTDDAAAAEFVLVDDAAAANPCTEAAAIRTIRLDAAAARPDLTVAFGHAPAAHK